MTEDHSAQCKTCNKHLHLEKASHQCSICDSVHWCSAECWQDDWADHQSVCNVVYLENENEVPLLPYGYVDTETGEQLEVKVMAHYVDSDNKEVKTRIFSTLDVDFQDVGMSTSKFQTRIVKSDLGIGRAPEDDEKGNWHLELNQWSKLPPRRSLREFARGEKRSKLPDEEAEITREFEVLGSTNMLYATNVDDLVKRVAQGRKVNEGRIVLWYPREVVAPPKNRVVIEGTRGTMQFEVKTPAPNDSKSLVMVATYTMLWRYRNRVRRWLKKRAGTVADRMLRAKGYSKDMIRRSFVVSAKDGRGMQVVMTLEQVDRINQLSPTDLEVSISDLAWSRSTDSSIGEKMESESLKVDADDLDQVTGLAMALNHQLQCFKALHSELKDEDLEERHDPMIDECMSKINGWLSVIETEMNQMNADPEYTMPYRSTAVVQSAVEWLQDSDHLNIALSVYGLRKKDYAYLVSKKRRWGNQLQSLIDEETAREGGEEESLGTTLKSKGKEAMRSIKGTSRTKLTKKLRTLQMAFSKGPTRAAKKGLSASKKRSLKKKWKAHGKDIAQFLSEGKMPAMYLTRQ